MADIDSEVHLGAERRAAVEEIVRAGLKEVARANADAIRVEHHLVKDLAVDSLEFLRMASDLEERLGVVIDDKALAAARTAGDLIEICCAAVAAQGSP